MADFNAKFSSDANFKATFKSDSSFGAKFGDTQIIEIGHYAPLPDKPLINGEVLLGDKSFEDLGDHILTNLEIKAMFDRVFKGGN